jgi:hypothetical protein
VKPPRWLTRGKPDPEPEPRTRAVFYHQGTPIVVVVPERIRTINVPCYMDGSLVEYHYHRVDECLPTDNGLAVVFKAEAPVCP